MGTVHSECIYLLRIKRIEPISVMIAIVTAIISSSVMTIFTAVELEKLKAKQQKADIVAKLGLMASKEISNSQLELIRLTSEVGGSLEKYWSNIDTIQHVLLVCDVADRQVSVMESVMQVAMGGHMSVAAFTKMHYARIAMKISREAKDAGLLPVAKHFSDYLQMETSFVAGPDGFSTLVQVPLIDMKSALTIWEHHILPIPLQDNLYLNIGPAEYTHLAVTADHKLNRAMTRAEFNTCRRLGEFYLCDRGLVVTKAPKIDETPPQWKDPAQCLFVLFVRRFELAAATCRTSIGGKEAAMRMVALDAFGSYTGKPRGGTVTCRGKNNPGGPETRTFTANGLTKITLPHGCTAETSTHIFAAADDGFSRSDSNYKIAYVWPFDPLTLTPGLNTKLFSEILKKNLSSLENSTRHNIPLDRALQAVAAYGEIPVNLNNLLDSHHYMTVPVLTTVIFMILIGATIGGVVITHMKADNRATRQNLNYLNPLVKASGWAVGSCA
jgi:hypothetical protein